MEGRRNGGVDERCSFQFSLGRLEKKRTDSDLLGPWLMEGSEMEQSASTLQAG